MGLTMQHAHVKLTLIFISILVFDFPFAMQCTSVDLSKMNINLFKMKAELLRLFRRVCSNLHSALLEGFLIAPAES